jgi:hypothetical protein
MSQQWEFLEDATGQWRWRSNQADGSQNVSSRTFKSGVDCVVHAMRNGYLAGTAMAEALERRQREVAR